MHDEMSAEQARQACDAVHGTSFAECRKVISQMIIEATKMGQYSVVYETPGRNVPVLEELRNHYESLGFDAQLTSKDWEKGVNAVSVKW